MPASLATRTTADAVRPLRTKILRPSWTDRLATYPEDDDPATLHVASVRDGRIVAVGTFYAEAPPGVHRGAIPNAAFAPGASVRLRGMASAPDVRGLGHGAAVLRTGMELSGQAGARFLWCNARLVAVPFYERMGLAAVGLEFDIPGIGPHFVMWGTVNGS